MTTYLDVNLLSISGPVAIRQIPLPAGEVGEKRFENLVNFLLQTVASVASLNC